MSSFGRGVALVDGEQPAYNYVMFNSYAEMIAGQLEGGVWFGVCPVSFPLTTRRCVFCAGFLEAESVDGESLLHTLQGVQRRGDLGVLCMDYVLASVDFDSFLALVEDFQAMFAWSAAADPDFRECEGKLEAEEGCDDAKSTDVKGTPSGFK